MCSQINFEYLFAKWLISIMEFCEEVSKYLRTWKSDSVLGRMNSYEGKYSFKMDFFKQWVWEIRKFLMIGLTFPELPVVMSFPCSPLSVSVSNFVFSFVIFCTLLCYCCCLCLLMTFFWALALFLSYPIILPLPQFIFFCRSIISHLFLLSSSLILLLRGIRTQVSAIEMTLLFFLFSSILFPATSLFYLAVL